MTRNDFLKTLVGLFSGLFFWKKLEAEDASEWLPPGIYTKDDCPISTFDRFGNRLTQKLIYCNTITGEIRYYKVDEEGKMLEDIELGELVKETSYAPAPLKCRQFTKEDYDWFDRYRKENPFKGTKILGCTCKKWVHSGCPMWKYHESVRNLTGKPVILS